MWRNCAVGVLAPDVWLLDSCPTVAKLLIHLAKGGMTRQGRVQFVLTRPRRLDVLNHRSLQLGERSLATDGLCSLAAGGCTNLVARHAHSKFSFEPELQIIPHEASSFIVAATQKKAV